jgi:hypothetical protein
MNKRKELNRLPVTELGVAGRGGGTGAPEARGTEVACSAGRSSGAREVESTGRRLTAEARSTESEVVGGNGLAVEVLGACSSLEAAACAAEDAAEGDRIEAAVACPAIGRSDAEAAACAAADAAGKVSR